MAQDAKESHINITNLTPMLNAFGVKPQPTYDNYDTQPEYYNETLEYKSPRRRRSRRRQQRYKRAPQYVVSQEFSLDYNPHKEDF